MCRIRVQNGTRGECLVTHGRVADTMWTRLKGLIGSGALEPGEGLLIVPCRSVHTHFPPAHHALAHREGHPGGAEGRSL
jgi:hypothetical protein